MGIVAGAVAAAFVVLRMAAHDWDITALIRVGDERIVDDAPERQDLAVVDGTGYDGQYYYRQALDPLSTDVVVDGIPLDRPAYRSARIGYPAAAWVLSAGGERALVPWALMAVNLVSIAVIGAIGASFARRSRRSTLWGLAFAGWPGFVIALGYDLAEPLEAALVLAALHQAHRRRVVTPTLLLVAAALTRESSLIVPAAFLGVVVLTWMVPGLARRLGVASMEPARHLLPLALLPIAAWGAIQLWMSRRFEGSGTSQAAAKSAEHVQNIPGVELVRQIGDWFAEGGPVAFFQLGQVLVLLLFFAAALATLRSPRAGSPVARVCLVGATLFVLMLGHYDRMVVYLRWPHLAAMLGLLVYVACPRDERPAWVTDRIVAGSIVGLWITTVPVWIWI